MENKKDLGSLFKKRLEGAEAEPSNTLWQSIESTLNEKQKRRGGFLLFWSSLVIVLLLLSFSYILFGDNVFEKNSDKIEIPITENDSSNTRIKQRQVNSDSEVIVETRDDSSVSNNSIDADALPNNSNSKEDIITSTQVENITKDNKSVITGKYSSDHKSNTASQLSSSLHKNQNSNKKKSASLRKKNISSSKDSDNQKAQISESFTKLKKGKLSDSTKILKKVDSTLTKPKPVATKKKAESEIEVKKKKQDPKIKWLISVHASPTVYGYIGESSPFNKSLSNGQLRSGLSYAYSALFNIPLSDKLTFRFGYRKTNLKFSIEQASAEISNNGTSTILNAEAINRNGITLSSIFVESLNAPNTFRLDQEVSYKEIPFQFLYQIKDSSVKIDAIVGVSAILLSKNSISLSNELGTEIIGSSAYLKKAALSSSIGLGFRYQLSPKVRLDLEPTFQYQLNANETGFGYLKPIILNLNAGATIKL